MKTYTAKPETVQRDWFVVDAAGQTLGRLATEIARRLRGKHKPEYPKNPLGRDMYRKLKVYKGASHPHTAQQPQELKI